MFVQNVLCENSTVWQSCNHTTTTTETANQAVDDTTETANQAVDDVTMNNDDVTVTSSDEDEDEWMMNYPKVEFYSRVS